MAISPPAIQPRAPIINDPYEAADQVLLGLERATRVFRLVEQELSDIVPEEGASRRLGDLWLSMLAASELLDAVHTNLRATVDALLAARISNGGVA